MSEADRKVNVLITFALEPELVQQIEAVDPRIEVRVLGQQARQLFRGLKYPSELEAQTARRELEEAMSEAEVLFGFWGPALVELYPDPDMLRRAAPHLRWIQLTSAGVDRAARSGLIDSDFLLTNASGLPDPLALRELLGPLDEIAEMTDDLERTADLRDDALAGKSGRRIAKHLLGAIGERRQRVPEQRSFASDEVVRCAFHAAMILPSVDGPMSAGRLPRR